MQNAWTKAKRMKIQRMFEQGKTRQEVADEMGVTDSIIVNVCRAYFIKFPMKKTNPAITYHKVCMWCGDWFTRTLSGKAPEPKCCSPECSQAMKKQEREDRHDSNTTL